MNANNNTDITDELLELLPWFTLGKLAVDDKVKFDNALQLNPSLQKQFKTEKLMIGLVSVDKSLLEKSAIAPTEVRLKSVLNVIDAIDKQKLSTKKTSHNESGVMSSLVEKLKNTFNSLIPNLEFNPQYARFTSVSLLVASIAALASFVIPSQKETSEFIPASAVTQPVIKQDSLTNTANITKTVLLVGFNGTVAELSSNIALKDKQIKILSPENKDGFFQISFQDSINADEIQQTIDALLAQEETVWFAGEGF